MYRKYFSILAVSHRGLFYGSLDRLPFLPKHPSFAEPLTVKQHFKMETPQRSGTLELNDELMRSINLDSTESHDKKGDQNTEKSDHLARTSSNTRDEEVHSMTVTGLRSISPTVKEITLRSSKNPPHFNFRAGQWVDVFIPGVETVGGFSMCSSPQELSELSQLRLAIKASPHPPAFWVHNKCKIGDKVDVRVGGDFYLSSEKITENSKILLVAGGIGINPLCSIVHHIQDRKKKGLFPEKLKVQLLYSAKTQDELVFKKAFDEYALLDSSSFKVNYYLTKAGIHGPGKDNVQCRRMHLQDLLYAINWICDSNQNATSDVEAFLCGPPPMIKNVNENLKFSKITKVNYEQWW